MCDPIRKTLLVSLLAWLWLSPSLSYAAVQKDLRGMQRVELWQDEDGKRDFADLPQDNQAWTAIETAPNFGFSRSTFWFRFQLAEANLGQEVLVLLLGYPLIDDIQLFMPDPENGSHTRLKAGRMHPVATRSLQTQDLTLEIPRSHQLRGQIFYLRIQTQGSAQFPMQIMGLHQYLHHAYESSFVQRLMVGAMLIMIVYNLIFYLVTRVKSHLAYVLFVCCMALFVTSTQGMAYFYLWPESMAFNRIAVAFFLGLSNATLCIFNIVSLSAVLRKRWMRRALEISVLLGFLNALGPFFISYHLSVRLVTGQTVLSAFLLPSIYIVLCREKYRPAYFFLLSVGTLALGAMVVALKAFGFLPNNMFTENAPIFSAVSQITLLTMALADQHRDLQKQNTQMQKKMIRMQQESIQQLDQKVEEKTRDVRVILNSIQQGIFTISGDPPKIDEEYSRHLQSMFPEQTISGRDPLDFLIIKSELSGDEQEQIRSAIVCTLDSHRFNFELNEGLFPRQIVLNPASGRRVFEVEWSPVLRKDETAHKILVALRDVTRLLELEEQTTRIDAEYRLMTLVLSQTQLRVRSFLQFNHQLLNRLQEEKDGADLEKFKGLLHTLKGNSRTFGLTDLANCCHELEELIRTGQPARSLLQDSLQKIEEQLSNLERAADRVSDVGLHDQELVQSSVHRSLDALRLAFRRGIQDPAQHIQRAAGTLAPLVYRDLEETMRSLMPSVASLAKEQQKSAPEFVYEQPGPVFIEQAVAELLQSSMVHLFSNAMIHGLETDDERRARGKRIQGSLRMKVHATDDTIGIIVADDGRGLCLDVIRQKALASGLLTADEKDPGKIAEGIFGAGISTAREVSLYAGRGVGMTAVRSMLAEIGATIHIELPEALKANLSAYQPFQFIIRLPRAADTLLLRIEGSASDRASALAS